MKKAEFTCKTSFRKTKQSTSGRTPVLNLFFLIINISMEEE